MQKLLQESLIPQKSQECQNLLLLHIQTPQGYQELKKLLNENDNLAFIFLKNSINKIENTSIFTNDIFYYYNLINCTTQINFNMLLSFFEFLSLKFLLDFDFFQFIYKDIETCQKENLNRNLKLLVSCFKKYESMGKNNKLYIEINQNIEIFGNLVCNLLVNQIEIEETLKILFFFIFQDIPTFFEIKCQEINQIICSIYANTDNNSIIELTIKIMYLFVTKYIECSNLELILETLVYKLDKKIDENFNNTEILLLIHFVNLKQINLLQKNINSIINILYKMCFLHFDFDPLNFSRNTNGIENDPYRRNIAEAITTLDNLFNIDYLNIIKFENQEADIFFFTVLKHKFGYKILQDYKLSENDENKLFSFFRFLILNYDESKGNRSFLRTNENHLERNKNFLFDDLNFTLECLFKFNFAYYKIAEFLYLMLRDNKFKNLDNETIFKILNRKINDDDDEFTSKLINLISKTNKNDIIYNYVYAKICQFEKMTSYDSFFYLFDSFSLFLKNIKFQNEALNLIINIFKTESQEIYSFAIQIAAILILNGFFDTFFMQVFSNENLWSINELKQSLCILTISLYRTKKIEKSVLENLIFFMIQTDSFNAYLLLENMEIENNSEYFNLLMKVCEKNTSYENILIVLARKDFKDERKNIAIEKCLDELLKSVVSKKNLGRVRKSLLNIYENASENFKEKISKLILRNEDRKLAVGYFFDFLVEKMNLK